MARSIVVVAFASLLGLYAGCAVNPITGDQELMLFSMDEDIKLGAQYAPEVEKELEGEIPDEALQSYIDRVGQRIATVSHRPDIKYHFAAVDHEMVNAIAVPGGHVFVTRGILAELDSEAQLAAILGHEVAHVVARDSMAAMSRQYGMAALLAAAQVGGADSRVMQAATFTAQLLSLRYSRTDEYEADQGGLDYMVKAGYDPRGMVETMQMLQSLQEVRPIEFFSTHPSPENRIGHLNERIESRYAQLKALKVGKDDYAKEVLERLKATPKKPRPAAESAGP